MSQNIPSTTFSFFLFFLARLCQRFLPRTAIPPEIFFSFPLLLFSFFLYTKRSLQWSERCEKRGGKNRICKKKLASCCCCSCLRVRMFVLLGQWQNVMVFWTRGPAIVFFPSSPPFRCFARKKNKNISENGKRLEKREKEKSSSSKDTSEFFFHPTELLRPGSRLMCLRKESREGRSRQIWQGCWTLTTSDLPTFSIIPWLEKKTAQTNGFLNFV